MSGRTSSTKSAKYVPPPAAGGGTYFELKSVPGPYLGQPSHTAMAMSMIPGTHSSNSRLSLRPETPPTTIRARPRMAEKSMMTNPILRLSFKCDDAIMLVRHINIVGHGDYRRAVVPIQAEQQVHHP